MPPSVNQVFDPSAATTGSLNANGTLTLAALAINNTGTWSVQGGKAILNASQGITNSGTIQKAGELSLATGGTLTNSGQIVGGSKLSCRPVRLRIQERCMPTAISR
ncbi:hypothetical protein ACU4HD_28830 [Cupriavidus basilensis]